MLRKSRQEVMRDIEAKIRNMNSSHATSYSDPDVYVNFKTPMAYDVLDGHSGYYPTTSSGWPPQLVSFIKDVALATALAVIDEVLTEQEIEKKFNENAEQELLR